MMKNMLDQKPEPQNLHFSIILDTVPPLAYASIQHTSQTLSTEARRWVQHRMMINSLGSIIHEICLLLSAVRSYIKPDDK